MIVNFPRKGDLRRPFVRAVNGRNAKPRLICRWIRDTASGRLIAQWSPEHGETGAQGADRPPSSRSRLAA